MGGEDTPASGFALYLDRLMNIIPLEKLTQPSAGKILVRTGLKKAGDLKGAFDLATSLHQAGYPAEVYLGGPESANLKWTVEIRSKEPCFVLTDRVSQQRFEVETGPEVLVLLGGEKRRPSLKGKGKR